MEGGASSQHTAQVCKAAARSFNITYCSPRIVRLPLPHMCLIAPSLILTRAPDKERSTQNN